MAAKGDQLARGMGLQSKGDWKGALACFRRALEAAPSNPEALMRAGLAEAHEGRMEEAAGLLRRAVEARPGFAEAEKALGGVLLALERHAEAAAALERAQALGPASAAAQFDLGSALLALRDLERAAKAYERAAELRPGFAEAYSRLGNVLMTQKRHEDAARAYGRAAEAAPEDAQAWYNLGLARQAQRDTEGAIAAYRRALSISPKQADAENNMGLILAEDGRNGEAISAFRRALSARPGFVMAIVNLATALQRENAFDESVALLGEAIRIAPGDFRAHAALGNAHVARNRLPEALASYEAALAAEPGLPELRYNIALVHLAEGNLGRGLAGYEARLETDKHRGKFSFAGARWHRGVPAGGRTLLVYAEQGIGDTLQFARFIPALGETGARIVFRVQQSLVPLLSGQWPGVRVVGTLDPVPDHDLVCPLLSLPHELGTELGTLPAPARYLSAPPEKLAVWRNVFAQAPGLKVGLVWSGNPKHQYDHNRSMPLERIAEIVPGMPAHFFSLQKELRGGDAARLGGGIGITDLSRQLSDFGDTAAVVAALDLVITVDTSAAHLSGAVGTPTWVLLAHAPDWRWLLGRDDSPWYPSVRLFRQPANGDWPSVIAEVRRALAPLAG